MSKLFGTDGIRGIANELITADLALKLGKSVGAMLIEENGLKKEGLSVCIGTDTRVSLFMIENAIISGLCSVGINVDKLEVISTPGVAYILKEKGYDAGIMVTASHNPWQYNGIKVLNTKGFKISDKQEEKIEDYIAHPEKTEKYVSRDALGEVRTAHFESVELYSKFVLEAFPKNIEPSKKLKVLIDCANGSAVSTVHDIFSRLPIEYKVINDDPSGKNINLNCGSLYATNMSEYITEGNYDIGIAFDGDADRLQLVDKNGVLIDGDEIIAMIAIDYKKKGKLKKDTVVGTVMTNFAMPKALKEEAINFVSTNVGDRYVLEEIEKSGYSLGGEQSGHIILRDLHTLGDGQLCAVYVLGMMIEQNKPLHELADVFVGCPQMLENVRLPKLGAYDVKNEVLQKRIEEWEEKLADNGRILIRPSGTEPLIRVMVEGTDESLIKECVSDLVKLIEESL